MDARNHRILPTPNSDEPLSYLNLGPTPYPNSGPTPYPNPGPTPYPNPTARPNPSPTPYPAQSKARATPFPIMQTSAATAQMFSPMYNQYNAQSVYNKPADLYNKPADLYNKPDDLHNNPADLYTKQRTVAEEKIAKDKAYNYDYIIGDTKDKEETDTVLPFMNNLPIQQKVHFVIFVLIIIILVLERMNYKVSIIYNIIHSYISFFISFYEKRKEK